MVATHIEAEFGPNVTQILVQGSRVIRGTVPSQVRAQLRAAVKAGVLGHMKKDGLKPEVFFNPDNAMSAKDRRDREAAYSISCIASVMAVKPVEQRIEEALSGLEAGR